MWLAGIPGLHMCTNWPSCILLIFSIKLKHSIFHPWGVSSSNYLFTLNKVTLPTLPFQFSISSTLSIYLIPSLSLSFSTCDNLNYSFPLISWSLLHKKNSYCPLGARMCKNQVHDTWTRELMLAMWFATHHYGDATTTWRMDRMG